MGYTLDRMQRIVLLLFLAVTALAQTAPFRIPAEEAAKHLINGPQPPYPEPARQTRIAGNVIIEVTIDQSGSVTECNLISGHPMLAPAALMAVRHWKYEPIQIQGRPTTVVTDVLVQFGNDRGDYTASGQAGLAFRYGFWTAEDAAEVAIARNDYARALEELNKAKGILESDKASHLREQWQWLTTAGRLSMLQQNYEESEHYYKDALALRKKAGDKDSSSVADSLANLAALYAQERHFDQAHDSAARAFDMLEKEYRRIGTANQGARQAYGRAAAQESWLLVRIAKERNDVAETGKRCAALQEFESYLTETGRAAAADACKSASTVPKP